MTRHIFFLTIILNSYFVNAQHFTKPDVLVQLSSAERQVDNEAEVLYSRILEKIVTSKRFNVLTRSPEMWKALEAELAARDLIDEKSMLSFGKLSGAKVLFTVHLNNFLSERKMIKSASDNGTLDYTFECSVNASVKVINLETGKQEHSFAAGVVLTNPNRAIASQRVIDSVESILTQKIFNQFPIYTNIQKVEASDKIIIGKGKDDGVMEYAIFNVLADSTSDRHIATVKITNADPSQSIARILNGSIKSLKPGMFLKEASEKVMNVAKIESIDGQHVIIDAGKDLNVKKGDIFDAFVKEEKLIGEKVRTEKKVLGKIYVVDVHDDYSSGKIIKGYTTISNDQTIEQAETNDGIKNPFLSIGYKSALGVTITPNVPSGEFTVVNELGEFDVNTAYLENFAPINNVQIYSFGIGTHNIVKNITTTFFIDIYKMKPLSNWIGSLNVAYTHPVIPEKLYMNFGPSIGYGRLKQDIPAGTVSAISGQQSSDVRSNSLYASAVVGVIVVIKRFQIGGTISYDYLKYSKWKYEIKVDESTTREIAPAAIVPYANVDLSALYYGVSLKFNINQ